MRLLSPILLGLLAFALFFSGLGAVGFVGPDEPRYAGVARAMLRSGDYVTPRLFDAPWFEKPPLYYWLAAQFFRLGLNEFAARLPSAISATVFLGAWFWFARSLFGPQTAMLACILLASSLGWIGFSRAATMDMLLATTLGAALLLLALWFRDRKPLTLYGFYGLLGLATLAKGPVAVALAGMIALAYVLTYKDWAALKALLLSPAVGVFVAVAVPWYALCYQRNGFPFIQEFFIEHNVERYTSAAIGHPQPWWFYVPIVAAAVFPWSPLLLLPVLEMARSGLRPIFADRQRGFLFYWSVLPFVFFSLSRNKLPGYLLPILPPLTLWIAHIIQTIAPADARARSGAVSSLGRWAQALMALSAVFLLSLPVIASLLPESLATGLGQAVAEWDRAGLWADLWKGPAPFVLWLGLLGLFLASLYLAGTRQLLGAALALLAGVSLGMFTIAEYLSPSINRVASVQSVAQRIRSYGVSGEDVAVYRIHRNQSLGLSFYLDYALPEWSPDSQTPGIAIVVAPQEEPLDKQLPGAQPLSLFPGQRLRVWEVPAKSKPLP